jgi:site-specific recombinase XerD
MKTTDFAKYLTDYLTSYLISEKGVSQNTIKGYRDTFVQFIDFMATTKDIKLEKLTLSMLTKDAVSEFLNWIQKVRKCSVSTRNARLAAIHSFVKYVQYHHPDNLYEFQRIMAIKSKKHEKGHINYLTLDAVKILLDMPNKTTRHGRRDLALLCLMYDTGCRVQELADIRVQDVHLQQPYLVTVRGKGDKIRQIPLLPEQTTILQAYIKENKLDQSECRQYPLFVNNKKEKLTRGGITHILKKYVAMARQHDPDIPENISCHSLRHSKAMHLLQAGMNLVYIRDILGHVSIQTTEVYARADSKQKREAIAKAYKNVSPEIEPLWENDKDLLSWLKSF